MSPEEEDPLESSFIRIVAVRLYVGGVFLMYRNATLSVMINAMTNQYHLLAHR